MNYQKIDIPFLAEIQEHFLPIIEKYHNSTVDLTINIDGNPDDYFIKYEICLLLAELTGKEHVCTDPLILIKPPGDIEPFYHIDNNIPGSPSWVLNIPLYNCDQTKILFASGEYSLIDSQTENGIKYLKVDWATQPDLMESVILDKPIITRTNVPYDFINYKDTTSIILSLRFEPDIFPPD